MNRSKRELILAALDGSISPEEFDVLQSALLEDEETRLEYLGLLDLHEDLTELSGDVVTADAGASEAGPISFGLTAFVAAVVAASVLFGLVGFWGGHREFDRFRIVDAAPAGADGLDAEPAVAGHASIRRMVDVVWSPGQSVLSPGDLVSAGPLKFERGLVELDFFCGATLLVEGPAALDVGSDWVVECLSGKVEAFVPPAARGFTINAAGSSVVDLGTAFSLEVAGDKARVDVIDGEVELRDRRGSLRLTTGEGDWLNGKAADSGFERRVLPSLDEVAASAAAAEDAAYADWRRWSSDLTADERLVAFYSGDDERDTDRAFVNMAGASPRASDGAIIGLADFPDGRFGAVSKAVALNRPGSRVRVHVDGEFRAYTFACWVRIDSLPNRYNALFMGDGYDNGEPHWQIHEDGRLMLSVMVDTSDRPTRIDAGGNTVVTDNGRHKVYFSPPVWDMSMSGRWLHIAATYDPATREVVHYLDGEAVSRHAIEDKFYIESLQIGPAEIGSWGQPFRDSPWFAVRTLHGAVDDLMVFDAAVDADEMRRLYKAGRPPGHLGQ